MRVLTRSAHGLTAEPRERYFASLGLDRDGRSLTDR